MKANTFNKYISILFHPIIYPGIGTFVFLFFTPRFFSDKKIGTILAIVLLGSVFIPLILLLFLKKIGQIKSFYLEDISERRYPFIVFTVIALLMSRVFFQLEFTYELGIYFISGSMGFLLGYWLLWFRHKISIHTLGLGSFIGFVMQLSIYYHLNFIILLAVLFVVFGVVAKARIELEAHDFKETIFGLLIGIIPQLLIPFLYQNI